MATYLDLITDALLEIQVLGENETPSAAQSTHALRVLNRFFDESAANRLNIYQVARTTFTITANDGSYTVGSGGDVSSIARPVFITDVKFVDTSLTPDQEFPLERLSDQSYADITVKDQTSTYPSKWYWRPTHPAGTLIFWPVPTSTTLTGVIYHWSAITYPVTLAGTVTLPPGYEEMLVTQLAVRLSSSYGQEVGPVLAKRATDAMSTVRRANTRTLEMEFEYGTSPLYDIRLG